MNRVILVGNLGADPELRYTQGGTAVGNFRMATNERRKKADSDEWENHAEWHRVVVWGKQAENAEKFLKKGSKVGIEGRIQTREWEDNDGNKRYTTEVVAQNVEFLSSISESGGSSGGNSSSNDFVDDDIPF